jgi:exosortase/archaeosortase family protein
MSVDRGVLHRLSEARFKLTLGYTIVVLVIGLLAQSVYRELFESILSLATSEEYSYLLTSLFTVFTVNYLSLRYVGLSYGVRFSKILLSTTLALLAISLYYTSHIDLEHKVALQGLSFALVYIALIAFIYEPITPSNVIPILSIALLIPPPPSVIDSITPSLSRIVGRLVGSLLGVEVVESPGSTQIKVTAPSGEQVLLSVEAACTGVVALSSILAIVPILAYVVSFSADRPRKKLAVVLALTSIALLVGIVGNIVRVLLIVYAATILGPNSAYALLYYTPSLVYSAVSVVIAFTLVNKLCKFPPHRSRSSTKSLPDVTWEYVAGLLALVLIFSTALASAITYATVDLDVAAGGVVVRVRVSSVEDFIKNPASAISTEAFRVSIVSYDAFLTRVLGALAVYRVHTYTKQSSFAGFLEVVDTTARLHTWQLCLAIQGYNVTRSWSENIEATKVTYIVIERGAWRGVLAYTIIPVELEYPGGSRKVYTRLSLIAPGGHVEASTALRESLTQLITHRGGSSSSLRVYEDVVKILSWIAVLMVSVLVAYSALVSLYVARRSRTR